MWSTKTKRESCLPLSYFRDREYSGRNSHFGLNFMRSNLNIAENLYRKDLFAHYGCVNAIEFSNDGEWLVSGGDDRRILLWNVEKAIHGTGSPCNMKGEHSSNIFCLGFDIHNAKIFSAGNDEQVIVHDAKTGATIDIFLHEEAVYGLSVDPLNDNVFASACDDGRVLIWDIRESSSTEPFCLASYSSAFHAVMYNPVEPRLLATANSKEGVSLWDVRQPRTWLLKFGDSHTVHSCMSVRFNVNGTQILALRRRLPPILFNIHSSDYLCQFDHSGYYNSCTMKSCCFAGDNDQFVLSGSDDFNLYMWRIPEEGSNQTWVDEAHVVLKGHRSIVNQVRFNPSNFLLASSGVEKIVKLWSPFQLPGSSGGLTKDSPTSDKERKVYTHEQYINLVMRSGQVMTHDYSHQSTQEDPRMMAFFDSLVQREIEGLTSDSSLSGNNSDSWLFNVVGSVSLSDMDSSSDGSSDGEIQRSASGGDTVTEGTAATPTSPSNNGTRSDSPAGVGYATAVLENVTGWNDDRGDGGENSDNSSRQIGDDHQQSQGGQMTETINWLIRRKRQQLLQAARLKHQRRQEETPRRSGSGRKSPRSQRSSSTTLASENAPLASSSSSSSSPSSPSASSASSSSSMSPSPTTPLSGVSLLSNEDNDVNVLNCSSESNKKRKANFGAGSSRNNKETSESDRRKLIRKRRKQILLDLTESDSDADDESEPQRKRLRLSKEREKNGRLSSSNKPMSAMTSESNDDTTDSDKTNDDHNRKMNGFTPETDTSTTNGDDTTEINVVDISDENGESSAASSSSTPDSGIASQNFENGSRPSNGTSPTTSTSDSSERTSAKFKSIKSRDSSRKHPKARNYRSTAKDDSD